MDAIRNELIKLGFTLELTGRYIWPDHLYKWQTDQERYGSHRIWITPTSNWYFKVEKSFQGYETGVEGYSRYSAFTGVVSSWEEFKVILKCTGVLGIIETTENILT